MNIKENFYSKLQTIREAKLSYDEFVKGRVTKDSDSQTLKDMIKKNNKNRGGGSSIMNRKYKEELKRRSSVKEEAEQLDELRGKSKEAAEKIKSRLEKKHDEKWEKTTETRKEKKSKGSEDTKDIDKERNNLAKRWLRADRYSKK